MFYRVSQIVKYFMYVNKTRSKMVTKSFVNTLPHISVWGLKYGLIRDLYNLRR